MQIEQAIDSVLLAVGGSGVGLLALRAFVRKVSADVPEVKGDLASARMLDRLQAEISRLEGLINRMQARIDLLETQTASANLKISHIRIEALDALAAFARLDECIGGIDTVNRDCLRDAIKRIIAATE